VRKFQIAVIGYNTDRCTEQAKNIAYEVGKEVARAGAVLVCGGLGGVMESACKGARENKRNFLSRMDSAMSSSVQELGSPEISS